MGVRRQFVRHFRLSADFACTGFCLDVFSGKIFSMEKNNWLLLALLAAALPVGGCSDDDDEDELVGNWVKVSDFDGVARCSAVTFTVNGKVYVAAGGYGGYKYKLNDLWAFNEDSGTWTQMASMEGEARTYAVGFSTDRYGYVGLGYDGDNSPSQPGSCLCVQIRSGMGV